MNLKISGDIKLLRLNFTENEDSGDKHINGTLKIVGTNIEFNVSCVQPNSDTKAAENFLKQHLLDSGAFSD
ncbi:MAG: hypothetical protein HEP71_30850 [Roseivirga sp.]|nr:hypothetical protein [Roseivirga sp.]